MLAINIWSIVFNNQWQIFKRLGLTSGMRFRIIVLIFSLLVALLLLVQACHNFHVAESDEDLADVERYLAFDGLNREPR